MKLNVLNIIIGIFIAACTITSCLDSDTLEFEYSSNASITDFSIASDIVTINGTDTFTVAAADYPFIIDQNEGRIYNADSLPINTDVSKVLVNITADTYGIYIVAEQDSLWEETDSLDFNNPINFKVMSESGVFGRTYKVEILVHKQDPDSLVWKKVSSGFDSNILEQKAVYANNNIYVFTEQETQIAMTMMNTADAGTWSSLETIDIPIKADYTSVIAWNESLYILANNELYTSSNGVNWIKVNTSQTFSKLLANGKELVGIDMNNCYISSSNGEEWNQYDIIPANFPTSNISFVNYPLSTNTGIDRTVLIGKSELSEESDTTTVVWTRLCEENEWTDLTFDENEYPCPKLENATIIRYNDKLYTFGGARKYLEFELATPFQNFYVSPDNGISWNIVTEKTMFPDEFNDLYEESKGNYSCVVDDNQYIWIMWSQTGEVWRGRINKFGFDKQ